MTNRLKKENKEYLVNLTFEDLKIIEQKFWGNYNGSTARSNEVLEKLNQALQGITKEPNQLKGEWEKEFIDKFCGTGRFIDSDSFQECLSFIRSLLSFSRLSLLKETKQELIRKVEGIKKELIANPIQDFNLPHENTSEFNTALDKVLSLIEEMEER